MPAVPQLLAPHGSPALPHFGSFCLRSPPQFLEPRQDILALIFTDGKKLLNDGDQERTGYLFGAFWHSLWYQLQLLLQRLVSSGICHMCQTHLIGVHTLEYLK